MQDPQDKALLDEVRQRFEQKDALITEMQEMTRTLLALNKKAEGAEAVKTRFLSLIKNELNNPLSSLLGLSRQLGQKRDSEQFEEILQMLRGELYLMDFQLNNIFAACDIEAGESKSFYTHVDMASIWQEAVERLQHVIDEKKLELVLDNGCEGGVYTDHKKILLILLNLLSNACAYSYPQGRVHVSVACSGESIVLRIEDDGEGVSPEYQERMIEPFVQYTSGAARPTQGLGLGLAVVNALLQSEQGSLSYESKAKGSVFTAKMPLGASEEAKDIAEDGFFEL